LVTGANGFIGSRLCARLTQSGATVTAMVRPSSDLGFLKPLKSLSLVTAVLADLSTLQEAMRGVSVVYHVAGYVRDWGPWRVFYEANVEGVRNVMEAARQSGVKRVIHVSSVSVYGFPGKADISEEEPFIARPDDPYITTKVEGERLALKYQGKGLEVVVVRPAGVYGPHDRTTTAQIIPALLQGRFGYVDGGRHLMAPLFVENLVDLMMLAAERSEAPGQAYNAMDDGRVTWREYIEWMCEDLGCRPPKLSLPRQVVWPLAVGVDYAARWIGMKESPMINKYRIRAVMADAHYATAKAKRELGWRPRTSTREGIRQTIEWYRTWVR